MKISTPPRLVHIIHKLRAKLKCRFCLDPETKGREEKYCQSDYDGGAFTCTRKNNHFGKHVACGDMNHRFRKWR